MCVTRSSATALPVGVSFLYDLIQHFVLSLSLSLASVLLILPHSIFVQSDLICGFVLKFAFLVQ